MAPKKIHTRRSFEKGKFVVGAEASANISKIEGLTLTRDMRATFRDFARKGMSVEARRTALVDKYGKKGR